MESKTPATPHRLLSGHIWAQKGSSTPVTPHRLVSGQIWAYLITEPDAHAEVISNLLAVACFEQPINDQHRAGLEHKRCEEVPMDVVPGAVQLPI